MNKSQLVEALSAKFEGNKKAAAHALDAVLDTITREVARGEKVAITGFGAFEKRVREARLVRNPQTGELIEAAKKAVPKFTPGADLRNVISGAKQLPAATVEAAGDAASGLVAKVARKPAGKAKAVVTTPSAPAAKKTPATKTAAKKTPATKTAVKKTPATKTAAKKTPATKKAPAAKKTSAKKTSATKTAAKKTPATKTAAKKAPAKKAPATKTAAKKTPPATPTDS